MLCQVSPPGGCHPGRFAPTLPLVTPLSLGDNSFSQVTGAGEFEIQCVCNLLRICWHNCAKTWPKAEISRSSTPFAKQLSSARSDLFGLLKYVNNINCVVLLIIMLSIIRCKQSVLALTWVRSSGGMFSLIFGMHRRILIELNITTHYQVIIHGAGDILKVTGLKVKVTNDISQNALFRRRHTKY